jgi:hypothetical protein
MANVLKHIGRMANNKNTKVLVAFRTLPGESNMALVIPVANLSDSYHDAIMKVVEEDQAQTSFEFGEILFTRTFPDGRPMLQALRADEILRKVPTDQVEMTPTTVDVVGLHQLNTLIAEQKNCAVDDLYTFVSGAPKKSNATVEEIVEIKDLGRDIGEPNIPAAQPLKAGLNEALDDKSIARSYRSQADAMYKEAARLRKEADSLDPPQKKTTKVKESADA